MQRGVGSIQSYYESDQYIYIFAVLQKEPDPADNFHILIHKASGISKRIQALPQTAPAFQFIEDDQLLFMFQPEDILNMAKENPELFSQHKQVLETIQFDDNPVALFIQPKFK